MRCPTLIWLGVPNLGVLKYEIDINKDGDCEALDKNIADGCYLLRFEVSTKVNVNTLWKLFQSGIKYRILRIDQELDGLIYYLVQRNTEEEETYVYDHY